MKLLEIGITIIIQIIEGILNLFFEFVGALLTGPKKPEGYNAEFGNVRTLLSSSNAGFVIDGKRRLSLKDSFRNVLAIGGTGAGKTSTLITPLLLSVDNCSLLIHDVSGELYAKSAGYLRQMGYDVRTLNFTNPNSDQYNILHRANTTSDIERIAEMLVRSSYKESVGDNFWNLQAAALLALCIRWIKEQDKQFQNLTNVRYLLNLLGSSPSIVDKLFAKCRDNLLYEEYKGFIAYDSKVVSNVIASAKTCLNLFTNPAIQQSTSNDTIDFQKMRSCKTAIFIQNKLENLQYIFVLTMILFEQFFGYVTRHLPNKNDLPILVVADEIAALGKIPILPLALSQIRKFRTGCLLAVQDINQLTHNYGNYEKETIISNCLTRIYFTGQGTQTATELEKVLGKYDVKDPENTEKIVRTRSLMTSDEIRMLNPSKAIVISASHKPFLVKLTPVYKNWKLKKRMALPPPPLGEITFKKVPLIPITESSKACYE